MYVCASPRGLLSAHPSEVFQAVVDDHVGAEGSQEGQLFRSTGASNHAGPHQLRELQCSGADPAGAGVNQRHVALA